MQQRPHLLHDPGELQRAHAARGEREVDRAPALGLRLARVGTALVEGDREAAACQQQREQCSRKTGADDADRTLRRATHALEYLRQRLHEQPRILEAVVERHRRHANDVRRAPVTHHAARRQGIEHLAAACRAAGEAQRQLAAALRRFAQA